jgi:hypothetical protein
VFWAKEGTRLNKWLVYIWPYVTGQRSKQPGGLAEVEYLDTAMGVQFQRGIQMTYYHSRDREGFAGRELSYQFDHVDYSVNAFKKFTFKSRLNNSLTGARFFKQEIFRNRTTWQFNPYHSFRGIFDYDTSLRQFGASLLYAYVPRPNTTFYLGWNDLLFNGYDPLQERRARGAGLVSQRQTFFIKLSYNFRR